MFPYLIQKIRLTLKKVNAIRAILQPTVFKTKQEFYTKIDNHCEGLFNLQIGLQHEPIQLSKY